MATPVRRLMLCRSSALSSISTSSVASSSTLPSVRRSFSSSPLSRAEEPSKFNLWAMLTRSGANKKATDPAPSSPSINITSPGQSPYDNKSSVFLDGPGGAANAPPPINGPPGSMTTGPVEGGQEGGDGAELVAQAYSSSDKFYNPAWNVGAFGLHPKPAQDEPSSSSSSTSPFVPPASLSNLAYHPSLPAAHIHFPPLKSTTVALRRPQSDSSAIRLPTHSLRLPRLVPDPSSIYSRKKKHWITEDLDERWRQLSIEFKTIHHTKTGDQFSGRTFEFAAGGVGKVLGRFTSLVVRSNMRVEERRKQRFEHNPIKDWRLRRERHMRRFAVAMRRNVQLVHGLRTRGQSPVK